MRLPVAGSASVASLALLWLLGLRWTWSAAAAFGVYVGSGGWRFLRIVCLTAKRDLFGLSVLIRVRLELRWHRRSGHTIPSIFQEVVRRQPERLALVDAGSGASWTFAQLDAYSNAVAQLFLRLGFAPGDVVAVFLEGRPEFVGLWLGLAKAGVVASLLNVNLRREPLAFCLSTSGAKALIYGGEMAAAVAEVSAQLGRSLLMLCTGALGPESLLPDSRLLDTLLEEVQPEPLAPPAGKGMDDRLFYIYTSGTTGLPKAAIVVHSRYYRIAAFGHHSYSMCQADVLYDSLPLYHSAGNILGVGQCVIYGLTVVLRKKFSASCFWDDCVKYNCTVSPIPGPAQNQPAPPTDWGLSLDTSSPSHLRPGPPTEHLTHPCRSGPTYSFPYTDPIVLRPPTRLHRPDQPLPQPQTALLAPGPCPFRVPALSVPGGLGQAVQVWTGVTAPGRWICHRLRSLHVNTSKSPWQPKGSCPFCREETDARNAADTGFRVPCAGLCTLQTNMLGSWGVPKSEDGVYPTVVSQWYTGL